MTNGSSPSGKVASDQNRKVDRQSGWFVLPMDSSSSFGLGSFSRIFLCVPVLWLSLWRSQPPETGGPVTSSLSSASAYAHARSLIHALDPIAKLTHLSSTEMSHFLWEMLPFVIAPPHIPINESCRPPPLPDPATLNCSRFPGAFTGKRSSPAKIAHFMKFSFESDVLEALLNEASDLIDKFFVIEGSLVNSNLAEKPLLLSHLLSQPRFAKFRSQIVSLVLDAATPDKTRNRWYWELLHEQARWEKFLHWNDRHQMFSADDVLLFGDCDEIPSREVIQYFRWCKMDGPVDIGLWYTQSDATTEFRTDWPISQSKFLWGSPTAFTFDQALKQGKRYPTRTRGKSGRAAWGGIHLTWYGYLPFFLIKLMTITEETRSDTLNGIRIVRDALKRGETVGQVWAARRRWISSRWGSGREIPVGTGDNVGGRIIPWFIQCNRGRYQYFFETTKVEDPRIH